MMNRELFLKNPNLFPNGFEEDTLENILEFSRNGVRFSLEVVDGDLVLNTLGNGASVRSLTSGGNAISLEVKTLTNETTEPLLPGVYNVDSSGGSFNLSLSTIGKGTWRFINPNNSLDDNPVTILAGGSSFTTENGTQSNSNFLLDESVVNYDIVKTEDSSDFLVTLERPLPTNLFTDSGKLGVAQEFPPNSGEILLADLPINTDADANTFHGFSFKVGDKNILRLSGRSDNSGSLSEVSAEAEAFKLVEGGDQEATAFSLGFPALRIIEASENTVSNFTIPPNVFIREVIIRHIDGVGQDGVVVNNLQITSTVSNNTIISEFDMPRNGTEILSPNNKFPINDSRGESITVTADTWNNSSVKIYLYYQFLP